MFVLRLLSAAFSVVLWVSVTRADSVAQRAVDIVTTVCISPIVPNDVVATSEQLATKFGWSLDAARSGRRPGVGSQAHPVSRPISLNRIWKIDEPEFQGTLNIRTIGPEYPGQRLTMCSLSAAGRLYEDFIAQVRNAFGFGPGKAEQEADRSSTSWPLSGDPKSPDDGFKFITVATRNWSAGWFTDFGFTEVKSVGGMLLGDKF